MSGRYGNFQVIENLEGYLSLEELSENLDFPLTFILTHPKWKWDWKKVTRKDVSLDIILENIRLNWTLQETCKKTKPSIILSGEFNFRFLASEEERNENGWDIWNDYELINMGIDPYDYEARNLVEKHPNFPWNFYNISRSPHFTLKEVIKFKDRGLNWAEIYKNKTFRNWEDLVPVVDKLIPYMTRSDIQKIFTIIDKDDPLIEEYFDILFKNVKQENFHEKIPLKYVYLHPEKPWDWKNFLVRKDLTLDFILVFLHRLKKPCDIQSGKYICLETCKILPFSYIKEHPEVDWRWNAVSQREDIDLEYLDDTINLNMWDNDELSENPSIPFYFAIKHLNRGWIWEDFYNKPDFKLEYIEDYPDIDWPWKKISYLKDLTLEFIEKFKDKPWDWEVISKNGKLFLGASDGYKKPAKREEK